MEKTVLYDEHLKNGGKIVEFGGFLLPLEYAGLAIEHEAVRKNVGLFDVSHMGEIFVEGKDTIKFLNYLLTSNIEKQDNMRMQYALSLYDNGTIVDDLMVYKYSDEKVLIVCNASNTNKDYEWFVLNSQNYDVKIKNKSNEYGQLALQGPNAYQVLQQLTSYDVETMVLFDFDTFKVNDCEMIVSRSGYTGGDGFEIYGKNDDIISLFVVLNEKFHVTLCGLGARDTLRFEGTLPLYGHEISDKINPVMACLNFACDYSKDFIGKESILEYKKSPTQKLVGLELIDRGIARAEYEIYDSNDENSKLIGYVTTGYLIPGYDKSLALAMLKINFIEIGQIVYVKIRKNFVKAQVRDRKFMNKKYKK